MYMPFEGQPIHLTDAQRDDFEEIARSHALAAGFVQRAKIVLFLADGVSARAVEARLSVSRPTIAKWRRRFLEDGVPCAVQPPADNLGTLTGRHRGRRPWKLTVRLRARVLAATRRPPPDGTIHWSCRRRAAHLGVGKDIVQRVWREADLRSHRLARYMASNDPDFETNSGPRPARPRAAALAAGPDEEIHVILDNLSAHKTKLVEGFLDEHPNVTLHFTPTYSSWLNQVELCFSKGIWLRAP